MNKSIIYTLIYTIILSACAMDGQESNGANKEMSGDELQIVVEDGHTIEKRFNPPPNCERIDITHGSFASYLRQFPLHPPDREVYLYNGKKKMRQNVHAAVLDLDVGKRDLQQCADAVMRMRAEYLFHHAKKDQIHFNFTNGFKANYLKWQSGYRIKVNGNKVNWYDTGKADDSYKQFRKYLDMVFSYAGTLSLSKELKDRKIAEMQIGDVFIQGGSPGHAIIVMDMVIKKETGEIYFLLAQSYMPAQDMHILKNNKRPEISPWYSISDIQPYLNTPEWQFKSTDLKSFD